MKEIRSVHNPFIREVAKLKLKKYQTQESKFLVEGLHLIEEAKKAKVLEVVLKTDLIEQNYGVEEITVSEEVIQKLATTKTPQGIVGICRIPKNEIRGSRLLLLDNIQDPGNLGTLIRSAAAFGIDSVIISMDSVSPYNDKAIRATQGSIFQVNIIVEDLFQVVQHLKKEKIVIIGTTLEEAQNITNLTKTLDYAVLLGNEGAGVKQDLLQLCDIKVKIQTMRVESLNVAVAGSILLHHLF